MLYIWLISWGIIGTVISIKTKSKVSIIGGSFIASLIVIIIYATITGQINTVEKTRHIEVKDQEKYYTIKLVSCKIYPHGEPNNFRGKALEFILDKVLNENSDVRYIIKIETQTGFILDGDGFLTTSSTFDQPTERWLINMFLWFKRHDPREKWEKIDKEVNPGNIRRLHIILKANEQVIAQRIFENL